MIQGDGGHRCLKGLFEEIDPSTGYPSGGDPYARKTRHVHKFDGISLTITQR